MIDVDQLKRAVQNKWFSIFESLNIEVDQDGKHTACPIENAGKDRFRVSNLDGNGTWICTNCGAGDGVSLVRQCLNLDFKETLLQISRVVGMGVEMDTQRPKADYNARESLNKLWKASIKLNGGDPVMKYLHTRGLMLQPDNVRYCSGCWESDTKKNYPAMIAMFMGIDGKAVSLHRTYLTGTEKAKIKSPRKVMKGTGRLTGGAIRLFEPKNNTIGIAEGIETALAATQIADIPCWSAVSSTLLKSFVPPDYIKRIVIFGDNDANFCGQAAAYHLANRLYNADRVVEVELPPNGKDFNDWLLQRKDKT